MFKKLLIFAFIILSIFNGLVLYYLWPTIMEKQVPTSQALTQTVIKTFMLGETLEHYRRECLQSISSPDELLESYKNYLDYGGCAVSWKENHKASKEDLKDGWGHDFVFYIENDESFLKSLGQDKKNGGDGEGADLIYNASRKEFLELKQKAKKESAFKSFFK